MELYLSMLIGVIITLLMKLNKAHALPDFSWKIFIRFNWISTLINLLAGIVLIWGKDEILTFLTYLPYDSGFKVGIIASCVIGILGMKILQFIVDIFDPEVRTKIGINK